MSENKKLFAFGNLYTGYPWGVVLEDAFGSGEVHGPFNTENDASTYAHSLATDEYRWSKVSVCKIETPCTGKTIEWVNGDPAERHITFDAKTDTYTLRVGNWRTAITRDRALAEERDGIPLR